MYKISSKGPEDEDEIQQEDYPFDTDEDGQELDE